MKSWKGLVLILFSIVITALAWVSAGQIMFIVPGVALTTLALTFALATKSRFLEEIFHGIENIYFFHKVIAVFSMVLLVMHNVAMEAGLWSNSLATNLGHMAIYLFFSIILVAYLGKRLKYEVWRNIHRFVYLAYIFGLLHAYLILGGTLLAPTFLGLVSLVYTLIGLLSGFYIIFLYQTFGFRNYGRVKGIKHLNHDTTEIELEMRRDFTYDFGQFAFLKIFQEGFETAAHPFSISGGQGKTIFFTIKSSGDFTTDIYKKLQVGTKVAIDRSYGHMTLKDGRDKQVWIAGGIGITPFISYIRENPLLDKEVDFFYAFTGAENAVYVDMLRDYASKNPKLTLHIVDSKVDGYLNFDDYDLSDNTTVFMCGPVKMMTTFAKIFHEKNPKADLVYEGFSFR